MLIVESAFFRKITSDHVRESSLSLSLSRSLFLALSVLISSIFKDLTRSLQLSGIVALTFKLSYARYESFLNGSFHSERNKKMSSVFKMKSRTRYSSEISSLLRRLNQRNQVLFPSRDFLSRLPSGTSGERGFNLQVTEQD